MRPATEDSTTIFEKKSKRGGGREGGMDRAGREGERRMVETAAYVSQTRACLSILDSSFLDSRHDPASLAAPDAQARTRPTGYHPSQYTALALLIRTCPDTPAPYS